MNLQLNKAFILGLGLLLSACGSSGDGKDEVITRADGLRVETIHTDASAVQAAAPATEGKSNPGEPSGLLAYYPGSSPDKLVVFCHGLGHTVQGSWLQYVLRVARPDLVVVTTNYRDNERLPVLRGAHDTIAATLEAKRRFPSVKTVYLLGVSLGGAVSGTAIAESVHVTPDGRSLYDYWIALEPLTNLFEAYPEAALVVPTLARYFEEEAGGPLQAQPDEYQRRSPVLRVREMAAAGLKAVAVVHGVNDGLVTYNQGRELADALLTQRIPVQMYNVLRHADGQDPGTTGTGTLTGAAGANSDPFAFLQLAGHGSEADGAHPVMRTGFELLQQMLDGGYNFGTPYAEQLVDDG